MHSQLVNFESGQQYQAMSEFVGFDRIKHINQTVKDTVSGYIRNCQFLLPSNKAYYQVPELITSIILLFYYNRIESSILRDTESDKLLSLFKQRNVFQHLDNHDPEYKLIYSSVEHGDGEKIFKKICFEQPNLLCIIHDKRNNVFGGYTYSGWSTNKRDQSRDPQAFLFSIRSRNNYEPSIFKIKDDYNGCTLWNQARFYIMFSDDSCDAIYVNADGKRGYAYGMPSGFEAYPSKEYLTDTNFKIDSIEVFQLQA